MPSPSSAHRVAAVAVRGRAWLWRSLPASAAASRRASLDAANAPGWWHGRDLEERMSVLGAKSTAFLQRWLSKTWSELSAAPPGTLKHYMHRGASAVLAREDPDEAFFKSLPSRDAPLEVDVPENVPEKLARRRLRLLASSRASAHRRGLALWALSVPPQIPLLALPLPNVTIYYSVYRAWSHARALQGIRTLKHAIEDMDARQLAEHAQRMRDLSCGASETRQGADGADVEPRGDVPNPGSVLIPSRLERLAEAIHLRRISGALRARRLRERDESLFKGWNAEEGKADAGEESREDNADAGEASKGDAAEAAAADAGLAQPASEPSSPAAPRSSPAPPSYLSSALPCASSFLSANELLDRVLSTPPELRFASNAALPEIAPGASELAPEDVLASARALGDGGLVDAVKKTLDRQRKAEGLAEAQGWAAPTDKQG